MPLYKAKILSKEIALNYQEDQKQNLEKALNTINSKLEKYNNLVGKVSDYQILSLLTIELQDQIFDIIENKKNIDNVEDKLTSVINENIKLKDKNIELDKVNKNLLKDNKISEDKIEEIQVEIREIIKIIKKLYHE